MPGTRAVRRVRRPPRAGRSPTCWPGSGRRSRRSWSTSAAATGQLTLGLARAVAAAPGWSASTPRRRCWPARAELDRAAAGSSGCRPTWPGTRQPLGAAIDVLVTNATLQWVPGHLDLLPRWVERAGAGRLVRHAGAGQLRRALARAACARWPRPRPAPTSWRRRCAAARPSATPATYAAHAGRPRAASIDVWETTYQHVLDPEGAQRVAGAGVGQRHRLCARCSQVLTDEAERARVPGGVRAALERPTRASRSDVVFPFRRIFAVAAHRARPEALGAGRVGSRAAGWAWPPGRPGRSRRG